MAPKRKAAKDKTERQPFVPHPFEPCMGAGWFYYDESGKMRRWDAHADALSAAAKADKKQANKKELAKFRNSREAASGPNIEQRAIVERSPAMDLAAEHCRREDAARGRWDMVRNSDGMKSVNASVTWDLLVEAMRRNDERISQAKLELQSAREELDALDVKLLEQLSRERLEVMHAIAMTRQEYARAGKAAPTAKELHEELVGPQWSLPISLAAVKKATSLLSAMAKSGMTISQDVLIALLKEKAAAEAL